MNITIDSATYKGPVMIVVGYMVGQAALSGVLKELCDLHIPLLLVENLDEQRRKK